MSEGKTTKGRLYCKKMVKLDMENLVCKKINDRCIGKWIMMPIGVILPEPWHFVTASLKIVFYCETLFYQRYVPFIFHIIMEKCDFDSFLKPVYDKTS